MQSHNKPLDKLLDEIKSCEQIIFTFMKLERETLTSKTEMPLEFILDYAEHMNKHDQLLDELKKIDKDEYDTFKKKFEERRKNLDLEFLTKNQQEKIRKEELEKIDDRFIQFLISTCNELVKHGSINKYITTFFNNHKTEEFTQNEIDFLKGSKLGDLEYENTDDLNDFYMVNKNNNTRLAFSNRSQTMGEIRGELLRMEIDKLRKEAGEMNLYEALSKIAAECKDMKVYSAMASRSNFNIDISTDIYQNFIQKMIDLKMNFNENDMRDVGIITGLLKKHISESKPILKPEELRRSEGVKRYAANKNDKKAIPLKTDEKKPFFSFPSLFSKPPSDSAQLEDKRTNKENMNSPKHGSSKK